jgi:citrate lyase subunit beta / citryl-CoA lyase
MTSCADARSLLFVPGNRPHLFEKAADSGADALILDLEDSVPTADKAAARAAIETAWPQLKSLGLPLVVRINAANSDAGEEDLAWLPRLSLPSAVMVSKAESARTLAQVHERLQGTHLMPLIESASGFDALPALAAAPGVLRLVVGHIDFMADTGMQCDEMESELAPLRFAVAIATRMNSLAPAIDGVTVQIGDDERLRADIRRALRFGFGGKLCIHPGQVRVVHEALAPSEQELAWARRVVAADAASGGAAVQLDGRMIDLPVVLLARRTLTRAASEGKQA